MATETATYEVRAGVHTIGVAAVMYQKAARELIEAAEAFQVDMERPGATDLSSDAEQDLVGRARGIADDVRDTDMTPERILDDVQELADLAAFFVDRIEAT